MAAYYDGHYRTQYTCIDSALIPVTGSSADKDGLLFYFVEDHFLVLHINTKELRIMCSLYYVTTKHLITTIELNITVCGAIFSFFKFIIVV